MRANNARPRVAFVGLGWIGLHRLRAVLAHDIVDVVALSDPDTNARERPHDLAPNAVLTADLDDALALEPDGVVLATPSAMHAAQCLAVLDAGAAVFCQKPLGRNAFEVERVIDAARRVNRLLGVDVSYRHTDGLSRLRQLVRDGSIGRIIAADLTFHNAYGPDKAWFYDIRQSGGGCLLDLGVHLVDFLHWTFDEAVSSAFGIRFAAGERLAPGDPTVEDFAIGHLELASGAVARVACSWKLSAGQDAAIEIALYGTTGSLVFRNVNGSFYDFVAECYRGVDRTVLCAPPDDWGGRAIVAWAQQLARSHAFDPEISIAGRVARTLDLLYGRQSDSEQVRTLIDRQHAPAPRS